ncbi:tRNA threonylcarbamoyladenosine biosynthesis protein TsaE [Rathayibacter tritici]|uniref:tRNA threonylcarbamoyladenosine biosynthesis protein TsaE n=2 Tax=Rathayibacter tritici TaxID=33888 RepID=A0A160KRP3_9MICO|nr:tRNA threonylcarbamoyladenosine biosynthesis protein TsaE [Rathayibacter tritici]
MPERTRFADRTVQVADPEAMAELGRELGRVLRAGDLLVLTGPLGAGKTTFTRGLGDGLGVRGPVTSPTFVIARTHPSLHGGPPLVHVDAYRVGSPVELDDLDLDLAHSVVVVEWGAGMLDGVAESWLDVVIERPTAGSDAEEVEEGEEGEEPVEPRTVRFRGTGWS